MDPKPGGRRAEQETERGRDQVVGSLVEGRVGTGDFDRHTGNVSGEVTHGGAYPDQEKSVHTRTEEGEHATGDQSPARAEGAQLFPRRFGGHGIWNSIGRRGTASE